MVSLLVISTVSRNSYRRQRNWKMRYVMVERGIQGLMNNLAQVSSSCLCILALFTVEYSPGSWNHWCSSHYAATAAPDRKWTGKVGGMSHPEWMPGYRATYIYWLYCLCNRSSHHKLLNGWGACKSYIPPNHSMAGPPNYLSSCLCFEIEGVLLCYGMHAVLVSM